MKSILEKRKINISVRELLILIFLSIIIGTAIVYFTLKHMGLLHEQGAVIAGLGDVVVGAIAALAVVYQLGRVKATEQKVQEIEESRFILQYNQVFIQDNNMCDIQQLLEKHMLKKVEEPIIDDDNRQILINYLVYLEGLAPLIFKNVLPLETIDDLLAYRFFLAMNNEEVQKDQLFPFPDYYKGCFKLYKIWKKYRSDRGLEILKEDNSLDKWWGFDKYIHDEIIVRKCTTGDNLEIIAELIYNTDRYIYPASFGSAETAKKILPKLIEKENNIFSRENIKIAIYNEKIVGVSVVLSKENYQEISVNFTDKYHSMAPQLKEVCERYFNPIAQKKYSKNPYCLCLCVDESFRGKKIGKILLIDLLVAYQDKDVTLHVLKQYDTANPSKQSPAIKLYEKLGFYIVGETKGYALKAEDAPDCLEMVRRKEP